MINPATASRPLIGLLAEQLRVESGPVVWIAALNLEYVGFTIVGLFIATWLIALAIWRFGRIEERWDSPPMSMRQ